MPLAGKSPLFVQRPETFGRFRVRADLGANRFGPVYLGKDPSSGARVTIRTFEPEVWSRASELDELLDSFRRLCAVKLDHPHVARPLAHGVEGNLPYLVYSYLPGTPMDVVVRQDGTRPPDEVLRRVTHVAEAIDAAAKGGVYHGMMAPCDLIFDRESTGVAGFGLAQALLRVGVSIEADAPYASPQRIAGAPPAYADDVYSLAALTLELLIGKASEANQEASRALREAQGLPERRRVPRPAPHETRLFTTLPGVDAGRLRAAFAAALADDAAERQPSGAEFVVGFREALSNRDDLDLAAPVTSGAATAFPSEKVEEKVQEKAQEKVQEKVQEPPVAAVIRITPPPGKGAADVPFRREPAPVRDFEIREAAKEPEPRLLRDQPPARAHSQPVPVFHSSFPELHGEAAPRRGGWLLLALGIVAGLIIGFTGGYTVGQRSLRLAIAPGAAEETPAASANTPAPSGESGSAASTTPSGQQAQSVTEPEIRAPGSEPASLPAPPAAQAQATPPPSQATGQKAAASAPAASSQTVSPAPPPASPETGRVLVRSTPSGAGVTVDGVTRGVTPLAIRDLELGEHTLEVAAPGHDTRQQRVTLTAQRPSRSLDVTLRSSAPARSAAAAPASSAVSGGLQIASRPTGGQVFLDDNLVGTAPLLLPDVSIGPHRVRIEMPGYQPWMTTVQIEPGARFRLSASLER